MEPQLITCPDCGGEGHIETLVYLTYNGDQTWKITRCERCDGTGEIEAPKEEAEGECQ